MPTLGVPELAQAFVCSVLFWVRAGFWPRTRLCTCHSCDTAFSAPKKAEHTLKQTLSPKRVTALRARGVASLGPASRGRTSARRRRRTEDFSAQALGSHWDPKA